MKEITMEMMESWIPELLQILKLAGNAILEVYHRDFSIQIKSDNSPVTEADVMSSEMILKGLQQLTPEVMVICEEFSLAILYIAKQGKVSLAFGSIGWNQ